MTYSMRDIIPNYDPVKHKSGAWAPAAVRGERVAAVTRQAVELAAAEREKILAATAAAEGRPRADPATLPEGYVPTEGPVVGERSDLRFRPTFQNIARAAFEEGGGPLSVIADERWGVTKEKDPDFDLVRKITDDDMSEYFDLFIENDVVNPSMYDAVKANILRQQKNDDLIEQGGATAWGLSMAAGILDPTILLPGGAAVRAGRVGFSVAKSALKGGAMVAAGAAAQEGVLHLTQVGRRGEKTVIAIGGAALLGGILGGLGAKLLSKAELNELGIKFAKEAKEAGVHDPEQAAQYLIEQAIKTDKAGAKGVGADVADADILDTVEAHTIFGGSAEWWAKTTSKLRISPSVQVQVGESVKGRETVEILADHLQTRAERGGAAASTGSSVEAKVKGIEGEAANTTSWVRDIFKRGRKSGAKYTRAEYNARVGKALRNGDVDREGDTFITEAAKHVRVWLDDMYEQGAEVGVFPSKMTVKTARSYLHRMWNPDAIQADQVRFRATIRGWLEDTLKNTPDDEFLDSRVDYIEDTVDAIYTRLSGQHHPTTEFIADHVVPAVQGPLRGRDFIIPDNLVEDFLENDVEKILRRYARKAGADIEIARAFPSKNADGLVTADMRGALKDISDDYDEMIKAAGGDTKRVRKLTAEKARTLRNISAMRDMLRGTFGAQNEQGAWKSYSRSALALSAMMRLPGVTVSSLADVAAVPGRFGVAAVFTDLLPALKKSFADIRMGRSEIRAFGTAMELWNNSRLHSLIEVTDYNGKMTKTEGATNFLSEKFFKYATFLPAWNDLAKGVTANMTINRMVRSAINYDTLADVDRGWLANLGIGPQDAARIRQLVDDGGITKKGGLYHAHTDRWMADKYINTEHAESLRTMRVAERTRAASVAQTETTRPLPTIRTTTRGQPNKFDLNKVRSEIKNRASRVLGGDDYDTSKIVDQLTAEQANMDIAKRSLDVFDEETDRLLLDAQRAARRERREFVKNFGGAVATETDRVIISPGIGDKPLITGTHVGKHVLQFKSFMLAANQRLLMSGLQGRPLWLAQHIVIGSGIGVMIAWSKIAEREGVDEANKLWDNPMRAAVEGLDRSGTLSVLMEINNTIERNAGVGVMIAANKADEWLFDSGDMKGGASRFVNRNAGDMMSPSFGLINDLTAITRQLIQGKVGESAVNAMYRNGIITNLPLVKGLIARPLKEQTKEFFGVEK